ncbi:ROK family protein [Enterococcus sp. OL5]|uniref:ROK family protein n=1 Tax=Enterococcus sp. OL5 TaxID=2590214 RepID=UPI00112DAC27|nr:ROK family protein [Enterococcus sp. OL5]TPR55130.1 ROK family protein [Enterococcus sp. OL5]
MKYYLGIDVGGSFIKYGVIDEKGNIISKGKSSTQRMNPEAVLNDLAQIILSEKKGRTLSGVGISLPGVINKENQLLTSGAIEKLFQYDVRRILTEKTELTILLVNDAKAISFGEKWLGAGKNHLNFVCLPLGTGVGGSIVINGQVYQGRTGAAGEFGMMLMGLGNTEPVGYESASFYCGSIAALCRIYNKKIGNKSFDEWEKDVSHILFLEKNGNQEAQDSVKEFYQNVAVLLLNISVSIDPEIILVGGGISENTEIMTGINQAFVSLTQRYSEISALGSPKIKPCALGNDAGMLGAVSKLIEGEKNDEKYGKIY